MFRIFRVVAVIAWCATCGYAQDVDKDIAIPPSNRWLWVVCGLPGDEEHERIFAETSRELLDTLSKHYGFTVERTNFHAGADDMLSVAPAGTQTALATRDALLANLKSLSAAVGSRDEVWVILIGHASELQGRVCLQLPGDDLSAEEFGDACRELPGRRQLFILTTAVSGSFLRPLAKPGRIVMSATEASSEPNETDYPQALARTLKKFADDRSDDAQAPTVLDLHNAVARDVLSGYASRGHLPTEHALLDDNGDGQGVEVQLRSLPIELGGDLEREASGPHPFKPDEDGYHASFAPLGLQRSPAEASGPAAN